MTPRPLLNARLGEQAHGDERGRARSARGAAGTRRTSPGPQSSTPSSRTSTAPSRPRGPGSGDRPAAQRPGRRAQRRASPAGFAPVVFDSGSTRHAPTKARIPSGRLIRKTSRQPVPNRSAPTSSPPHDGAEHGAEPDDRPEQAKAFGRSSVENAERMMPKPWGIMSAAASPWVSRKNDQHPDVGRDAAEQRARCEERDADHEQPPSAEEVAEAATDHEADGERQRVAADDPLQSRGARPEVGADRGRRDVDDRPVEQVHDLDDQDDREDEPATRVAVVDDRRRLWTPA